MIPNNIQKEHIIKALEECDISGVPAGRGSRKFMLEYNGKHYHPKYIVSIANKYASGNELNSAEFHGGLETNTFLKNIGFAIVDISSIKKTKPSGKDNIKHNPRRTHNERCPECKENIKILLEKIYGEVEQNYKFEVGVRPEDYTGSLHHQLNTIYEALQSHRGFTDFVRAKTLPNVDFFVPNPGFIVEFDESQHFTQPRKEALNNYPVGFEFGYDNKRWIELCEKISAKDNDPVYRDEQRAWYDTLRDFLPTIKDLEPTVRLYSKDYIWCSLNPSKSPDVKKFKDFIDGGLSDLQN